MFFGTTPSIISQFVIQEMREKKPKRVFVPFSGNFVIEQLVGLVDRDIEVHCTDVSLYSRAIGYYLADMKSEIKLKDEYLKIFPVFKGKKSPLDIAIQVIFFGEVANNLKKSDKAYYQNLNKDAIANQEKYYEQIKNKLENFKENIGPNFHFYGTDGCDLIEMTKKGDLCFYDPPVLLGDYEAMFKNLGECFEFDEPEYTQMEEEIKMKHLREMNERKVMVYYRRNDVIEPPKGYNEIFRYQYKYDAFYSIISNATKENWVGRWQPLKEEVKNYPIIGLDDEIKEDSVVELMQCTASVGNHYRLLWVKKAQMTSAGYNFLIFVDKKLIGMVTVDTALKFGSELVVIFSDPAAPTSRYRRLSKLILEIICTDKFLNMFNDLSMWEHKGFTTRVFTDNPVSMKYRNLFKLAERKEDTDSNWNYCLIYQNRDKIKPSYSDGLKNWLKKDGKAIR